MSDRQAEKKTEIRWTQKAAAITAAVFVWQAAAMWMGQRILLASPLDVLRVLVHLLPSLTFWKTVGFSLGHIFLGFVLALFLGTLLAVMSGKSRVIKVLLWPYVSVVKATPVASIIILLLVWCSSRNISIPVSCFMVFPVVYTNMLTGIDELSVELEEMASLFGIHGIRRVLYVRLGQMKPYLMASVEIGAAMAVKSGAAAEVIGIPAGSVGRQLYDAKIYLATPELFAWTFVLIVCSVLMEKVIRHLAFGLFALIEGRLS